MVIVAIQLTMILIWESIKMKINININKKIGVINITSDSFILEDLKAHICNKLKLDSDNYKMKMILKGGLSVELIQTSSKQRAEQDTLNLKGLITHHQIKEELLKSFSDIRFVTIEGTITNENHPKISVFFENIEGAITFFGTHENDYNKPISKELEKRVNKVYKILKPFLHNYYVSGIYRGEL